MMIAEVFSRKRTDPNGCTYDEDWVIIKKASGHVVKKMSLEHYLNTSRFHPAIR
jgi:hypothetical protein